MFTEDSSNKVFGSQSLSYKNKIFYLIKHSETRIFCSESLELFNLYKRFVENTIIELGEDWRIESGLLAQEIMAEKSLSNDEFCIFNEFMAGFLRKRLGQEQTQIQTQHTKIISEQEGQQQFLLYFNKSLDKGISNNQPINDFANNLTFKTLSLGFYITAGDIWTRTFKKYHQESVYEKFNDISIGGNAQKLQYFATLDLVTQKWTLKDQKTISQLVKNIEGKLDGIRIGQRSVESLMKAVKLGSVVVNITQSIVKSQQAQQIKFRTFSLCTQFYLNMFLIWLIFSIKKSFNSSQFSSTCYIHYCDIIISSRMTPKNSTDLTQFHSIYKQFKLLCDHEWEILMKDYMVALNDDKEVLNALIKRIGEKIQERFMKEIEGKRQKLKQINGNNVKQ